MQHTHTGNKLPFIQHVSSEHIPMVLVGNKEDDYCGREVSEEEGMELAATHSMPFSETSAVKNFNIDEVTNIALLNNYHHD